MENLPPQKLRFFDAQSGLGLESSAMDQIDRKIVGELHNDGRMSLTDLAESLPLSLSATSERLRRLRESGVITGFGVRIDPQATGRAIDAIVDVRLGTGVTADALDEALRGQPIVTNAMHLTGRFDTQLRVAARDVAELDELLTLLSDHVGAEETNTRLVLRTIAGFPRPAPL